MLATVAARTSQAARTAAPIVVSRVSACAARQLSRAAISATKKSDGELPKPPKVAVVLAGAGVYDGSEITEAVSALIHLARLGCEVECFAPDRAQLHVVNHVTGEVDATAPPRNVRVESARIARGHAAPLDSLDVAAFDAVIVPGGFGAAKNLCSFAVDGAAFKVPADVERVIAGFHSAKKPLGLCCISPVIAARVIGARAAAAAGAPPVQLTVGGASEDGGRWPYAGTAAVIAGTPGAAHVEHGARDAHVDRAHRVVTAAAYMSGTSDSFDVFLSVGNMVEAVVRLTRE